MLVCHVRWWSLVFGPHFGSGWVNKQTGREQEVCTKYCINTLCTLYSFRCKPTTAFNQTEKTYMHRTERMRDFEDTNSFRRFQVSSSQSNQQNNPNMHCMNIESLSHAHIPHSWGTPNRTRIKHICWQQISMFVANRIYLATFQLRWFHKPFPLFRVPGNTHYILCYSLQCAM